VLEIASKDGSMELGSRSRPILSGNVINQARIERAQSRWQARVSRLFDKLRKKAQFICTLAEMMDRGLA
jgi:hypothetical protein